MSPSTRAALLLVSCIGVTACAGMPMRSAGSADPASAGASVDNGDGAASPTVATPAPRVDAETEIPVRKQRLQATELAMDASALGYFMDVQHARLRQVGGKQLELEREGDRFVLSLPGPLNFEVGSAQLSENGQQALEQVAEILAEFRSSLIAVHGHTDDTGSADGNLRLSRQRALSVANLLQRAGVEVQRIVVIGHGAARPLTPNIDEASRERNRRVELVIEPLVKAGAKAG